MNIKNPKEYERTIWDWGILDGCFGKTKIKPTDVDGYVERRGRKLIIETKGSGVEVPDNDGQTIALKSFVNDGHTVLIVWGEPNAPEKVRIITPFIDRTEDCDLERLKQLVGQWFSFANGESGIDTTDPATIARAFWRRKGRNYCDVMMAEWGKLDELEKRNK